MTLKVLFSAVPQRWEEFRQPLLDAFDKFGLDADLSTGHGPKETDYIVFAPNGPVSDFGPFTQAKAVLSLWAGVESIVGNKTMTVPLTRMVDSGLREGMVEWVVGHALRYHLGMDRFTANGANEWDPVIPPLARNRRVGVLGLGELGGPCAQALAALNFDVFGWSRTPSDIPGVDCYFGADGLNQVLSGSEIVVLLLPATPQTDNILNSETIARLPKGARILNPGRGTLIDDQALLAAITSGQIAHATLDVFRQEPLPADHPFWANPAITVTPHIASETRAETAAMVVAENIRRNEDGQPLKYVVDREAGY